MCPLSSVVLIAFIAFWFGFFLAVMLSDRRTMTEREADDAEQVEFLARCERAARGCTSDAGRPK